MEGVLNDPEAELAEVLSGARTTAPPGLVWPYAYSKYLTERILLHKYPDAPILIVRPSSIAPALSEPFPGFEIRSSCPGTKVIRQFMEHTGSIIRIYGPHNGKVKFDEIPVNLVADILLAHTADIDRDGIFHAALGPKQSLDFDALFRSANEVMTTTSQKKIEYALSASDPDLWPSSKFYRLQGYDLLLTRPKSRSCAGRSTQRTRPSSSSIPRRSTGRHTAEKLPRRYGGEWGTCQIPFDRWARDHADQHIYLPVSDLSDG